MAVAGFSRGVDVCCCRVCSSDVSWSFWVVIVEGSLDTVTIFGPGDLFKRGDPLGMGIEGLATTLAGLAAPMDLSRGDIALVCTPSWPLCEVPGDSVAASLAPFNASLTRALTACGEERSSRGGPTVCPGEFEAPIGLAATAALSWLNAAARARGEA